MWSRTQSLRWLKDASFFFSTGKESGVVREFDLIMWLESLHKEAPERRQRHTEAFFSCPCITGCSWGFYFDLFLFFFCVLFLRVLRLFYTKCFFSAVCEIYHISCPLVFYLWFMVGDTICKSLIWHVMLDLLWAYVMEYAWSGTGTVHDDGFPSMVIITPAAQSGELTGKPTHERFIFVSSNYSHLYSSFHLLVNFNLKAAKNKCL